MGVVALRLIDKDEILKRKADVYDKNGHLLLAVPTGEIWAAKTVDAVPVVRCKDCDNWYGGDCGDAEQWHSCSLDALLRQGNWFCAGGRRRSE